MSTTLRLVFPQWQGGEAHNITNYVSELAPQEAMQGYAIGAQLLAWLAPPSAETVNVPVSMDTDAAAVATEHGIFAYAANLAQQQNALAILQQKQPQKVLTLGGDCAVSIAPFAYLAAQYADDVALLWLDAHPDLRLPQQGYTGLHAMSLAALLGHGDPALLQRLPATVPPERALIVGLRSPESGDMQRPAQFGVHWHSAESANRSSDEVLAWLRASGANKVMVHLDLDVLDPAELKTAVASDPDGLSLAATSRLINDVARDFDLVGLTVAEPMPREVIKLRRLLHSLPLMGV